MLRHALLLATVAVSLVTAGPALAQADQSVTATGTGQARVLPKDRHSNASIAAAYDAARTAAIAGALSNAHEYALAYANGAGLTLGSVLSVSDAQNGGYAFGPGPFFGPFAPNQFCGTIRQFRVKVVKDRHGRLRRKAVPGKKVYRCFVPRFAYTTLTVTYSAS